MPGPIKPPAKRINRVTKSIGAVKAGRRSPPMPRGLCQPAQDAWRGYWGDDVSGVMRPSDTAMAVRWVTNVDRYYRLIGEADDEPVVIGSTGQPRTNPIYDLALRLESSIREDERQLGIGPHNRLRLGVALSESARSLADLNAEAAADAEDPRVILQAVRDDA